MNSVETSPIEIKRVQAFAVSVRPPVGPESSLGSMPVRNGLLVALTAQDGVTGWGEIWCNFPPRGNLARLHLLEDVIAPQLIGARFNTYEECRVILEKDFLRMSLHTGEPGPYAHCLAGIDTALADISARRKNLPLYQFLSDKKTDSVPSYASTPNVIELNASLETIIDAGHTGVKLKIGHERSKDRALIDKVFEIADGRLNIMVDANQNWSVESAIETLNALSDYPINFVEEPLLANAPMTEWNVLSQAVKAPLAGGENITSLQSFKNFMELGGLRVVQPDVAKWGGVSGTMDVGRCAAQTGATCSLHWMGTGLGLAASIHTLAAIGGDGLVELDANPNPLRTELGEINLDVTNGQIAVPKGSGIGFIPDPSALKAMTIASFDMS